MSLRSWLLTWKLLSRRPRSCRMRRKQRPALHWRPQTFHLLEDRTLPSTINWIGGSGNWNDASNWDAGYVPTAADDAVVSVAAITITHASGSDTVHSLTLGDNLNDTFVLSSGTLSLSSDSGIGSTNTFNLSGGTLGGAGTLTVPAGGTMSWTAGFITGTTAVAAGGSLQISGSAYYKYLSGTLSNAGTVSVTNVGTSLRGSTGGTISNLAGGLFDFQDDSGISSFNAPLASFTNAGTVRKSGGSGTSSIAIAFNNTGILEVRSGTVSLTAAVAQHSGNTLTGGTWYVGPNCTLTLSGTITTNLGNITLDGTGSQFAALNNLASNGGSFSLLHGRNFTTAGNWNNGGTLVIDAGITFTVNGTLTNTGTINLLAGNGGTLTAQLDNQGTLTVNHPLTFNARGASSNSGTITLAGADLSVYPAIPDASLSNTATGIITLGGHTLTIDGVALNLSGPPTGPGTVVLQDGSTLNVEVGIDLSTANFALTVSGSTINGPGTVTNAAGKTLPVTNSAINAALTNQGMLLVQGGNTFGGVSNASGGTLRVLGDDSFGNASLTAGADLTNAGTVELTSSGGAYDSALTVSAGTLTNTGTISALAGGGARTVTAQLDNQGTLTVSQPLTFKVRGASVSSRALTVTAGLLVTPAAGGGALTNSGTATFSGNGGLTVSGGALTNAGTTIFSGSNGVTLGGGAVVTNTGTWDFQTDVSVLGGATGGAFVNQGTLKKSSGSGTSTLAVPLTDSGAGQVQALSGKLALTAGGATATAGFSIAAGATLGFDGGSLVLGSGASLGGAGTAEFGAGDIVTVAAGAAYAPGTTVIDGGSAIFAAAASTGVLSLSGGTLGGAGTITVTGTLTWTGGAMAGTGVTNVAPGGFLDLNGGNAYTGLRTINNEGTNISHNAGTVFVSTDNTFTNLDNFLAARLASFATGLGRAYANPIPLLGQALGATPGTVVNELVSGLAASVRGVSLAAIQQGLFAVFGPQGLNILNGSTPDSIGISTSGGQAAIALPLQVTFTGQTPFAIGLPGLPLQLDAFGTVQDSITITMNLNFAAAQLAGQSPTLAISPSTLQAQLFAAVPGLTAYATLGLIQAEAADDPLNPSSVNLTYATNFATDAGGNLVVSTLTNGGASVNLALAGSFGGDPVNDPTVTADFHLGWTFNNADPARSGLFGNTPTISFNNIQLYFGSFVADFLAPAVADVQQLTKPLAPLADFFSTPLPVLSDLAAETGGDPIYPADLFGREGQTITEFAQAIHVINGLDPTTLPSGVVRLGDFTVTDPRAYDDAGDSQPADILQNYGAGDVMAQIRALGGGAGSFFD